MPTLLIFLSKSAFFILKFLPVGLLLLYMVEQIPAVFTVFSDFIPLAVDDVNCLRDSSYFFFYRVEHTDINSGFHELRFFIFLKLFNASSG